MTSAFSNACSFPLPINGILLGISNLFEFYFEIFVLIRVSDGGHLPKRILIMIEL